MPTKPYTENGIEGKDAERLSEDKDLQKGLKKYNDESFTSLIKQVQFEYALCWMHQQARIQENLDRLKLYNNQKRDKNLVGDPLLFGIHQTLLAKLYNDRLSVAFEGKEEGDSETAENLGDLAGYDYTVMKKEQLDYMWDWDTLFTGRGIVCLEYFNRDKRFMCPSPELIDSFTWLRDPVATSMNGDMNRIGAMRFGGREIGMSKQEMKDNGNYINIGDLKRGVNVKSLIQDAMNARDNAAGLEEIFGKTVPEFKASGNFDFYLLEWNTHWKGKKVKVALGNSMKLIVRYQEVGDSTNDWGYIDRPLYPNSHSWDGVSIPDLVEDKQRQRSVALNLGLNILKADLYPSYVYNEKAIKSPQDLQNMLEFNKFIPTKGDIPATNAVTPLNKVSPNGQLLDYILQTLDASAQRATATPAMNQGQISGEDRTLGELNLVASGSNDRYSLAAKIFGWSENAFWAQWYRLYKDNFEEVLDEKTIRIKGAFGNEWRPLTKENITAHVDPDIVIESAAVSEAKNQRDRVMLVDYGNVVLQDPGVNRRYFERRLGRLSGLTRDEVDRLLPPTIDELLAEEENDMLNQDKLPPVNANDNHIVHWEIHSKAKESTAKMAHMQAHKQAMIIKRDQPEIFPAAPATPEQVTPTVTKTTSAEVSRSAPRIA